MFPLCRGRGVLAALYEGIGARCVGLGPAPDDGDLAADPAHAFDTNRLALMCG